MADEEFELNDDAQEKQNQFDKRIKGLSEQKVKLTAEKEAEAEARKIAEDDAAASKKEAEFYKSFNTLSSKYQGSAELQDKIKEKVMAGYDIEDATVAVLNREGKLTQPEIKRDSPAGGSAINQLKSEGEKTLGEMTRDEKRAKLMENEAEMIDLLSPKIRM